MLDLINKLRNTFNRDIFEVKDKPEQTKDKNLITDIKAKETVIVTINQLKQDYPAHIRQRKNVYNYLNKKLGLDIAVYDYDDTGENTILSLDPTGTQQGEYNYIVEKFTAALKDKKD